MKLKISFRQANIEDAELLIDIYNNSFYSDYVKYGECPGYGRTKEQMEESIKTVPKFVILCDGKPVGCVSCKIADQYEYEVGVLCIVPEYQGKGIGTRAIEFIKRYYEDCMRFTLVTPTDKKQNIKFYTEKCGFRIMSAEKDGHIELTRFIFER